MFIALSRGALALWVLSWASASLAGDGGPALHGRSALNPAWLSQLQLTDDDRQWLRSRGVLRVAVNQPDYAPFDISADGGAYEGISADYLRLVGDLLNLKIQVRSYATRAQAVQAVQDGEADLVSTSSVHEATVHGLQLTDPYIKDQPVLAARVDDWPQATQTGPPRVAMVGGYLPLDQLRERFPEAQLSVHATPTNAMAAVAFGQADVYVGSALGAYYQLHGSQLTRLQLWPLNGVDANHFGFAVARREGRLLALLNSALNVIPGDARWDIMRRWSVDQMELAERLPLPLTALERQWLQGRQELRVLMHPGFMPITYRDSQGRFAGVSADVLAQIARRTGLTISVIEARSLEQMRRMIARGEADLIAAIVPSAEREVELAFTRSFLTSTLVLVTPDITSAPAALEQLTGQRLALVQGSALQADLRDTHPAITQLAAAQSSEALALVDSGKAAAAVLPLIAARYMIARQYRGRLRINAALSAPPARFAFAVSPRNSALLSILNSALLDIPPPAMSELTRRWKGELIVTDGFWQRHSRSVIQGLVAALLSLLLALAWITYLRRLIRRREVAEAALNEQVDFMQVMIDGTPHPIYIRDRQACLVNCNVSYLKALGLERSDVMGLPVTGYAVVDSDQAHLAQLTYMQVMELGEPIVEDRQVLLAGGQVLTINHWMLPYRGSNGQIHGLIAGWVDITERQRLCEAYQDAQERAEAANQAKTNFLATMSHEIRTPMNAVLGMLELALKKAEQGMLDKPALEVASHAANNLLALIGDVLDVTRIEAGRLELNPEPCQLSQLASTVTRLFQAQAADKHLALVLEMTGAPDTWVSVDSIRFKQIVGNLISNAIKFTAEGHVKVLLGVWPSAQVAHVSLSVEDTGVGIAESEIQRLGGAYQQVPNSAIAPRMGAGLGLNICQSLLALMKGTLRLQSVLGSGTRAELQLDALLCDAPLGIDRAHDQAAVESALQVLVVDDYAANRVLLERQLTFLGHRVTLAEHGTAGLRAWLRGNFDVVISDCNMPGMNGYQLAQAIRLHERRRGELACLVLGCTANAQLKERELCMAHGMDDCLFKPLNLQGLAEKLSTRRRRWQKPCDTEEIDLTGLHQLTAGDELSLKRLLGDLAQSNAEDLSRLQALGEPYSHAEVGDLVHRIKGGARIVRAGRLVTACEALEQHCHPAAAAEDVRRGIDDLAAAMSSLGQYLQRYCRAG